MVRLRLKEENAQLTKKLEVWELSWGKCAHTCHVINNICKLQCPYGSKIKDIPTATMGFPCFHKFSGCAILETRMQPGQ